MKIISCFVETYGAIEKQKFDFDENLTVFLRDNGTGKTTLASFIRAMFYGLPPTKTNSVTFNDRERFYPFSGGKFGGTLTFEAQGKTYKIERFFDKKSVNKDQLKLYENGDETECDYSVGLRFFGVDERAFTRTVFFDGSSADAGDDAAAKLSDFVDDTDGASYEEAYSAVETARKKYKALRGDKGVIADLKAARRAAELRIENYAEIENDLRLKYTDKEKAEAEADALKARYAAAVNAQTVKAKRATYEEKKSELETVKACLIAFRAKYPCGIPQKSQTDEAAERLNARNAKLASVAEAEQSAERKYALSVLEREFTERRITQTTLDAASRAADEITAMRYETEKISEQIDKANANPLVKKFDAMPVNPDEYETARLKMDELRDAEERVRLADEAGGARENDKKKGGKIAITAIGAAILLVGAIVAYFNLYAGVGVIALGAVMAIAGAAYPSGRGKKPNETDSFSLIARRDGLCKDITSFTVKHGYYSRDGVKVDFSNFERDYADYLALKNSETELCEKLKTAERAVCEKESALKSELNAFGTGSGDLRGAVNALQKKYDEYLALVRERDFSAKRVAEINRAAKEDDEYLTSFLRAYKADGSDVAAIIEKLREDRLTYGDALQKEQRLEKELAQYKDLPNATEEDEIPVAVLAETLDRKNAEIAKLNAEIALEERELENYPDAKSALSAAEEDVREATEKYEILGDTLKYLALAEKKLKDEYVAPTLKAFIGYAKEVSEEFGENADMDKNFRVKFERSGELRGEKYFSAGQRAVISLCLRLALIDRTFKNEKPFVVLDDPFVALDETHFERVKEAVKKLSRKTQTIYFTCHESRSI